MRRRWPYALLAVAYVSLAIGAYQSWYRPSKRGPGHKDCTSCTCCTPGSDKCCCLHVDKCTCNPTDPCRSGK